MSFGVILGFAQLLALLTGIFAGFPIAFTLIVLTVVFGFVGLGERALDTLWQLGGADSQAGRAARTHFERLCPPARRASYT